MRSFVVSLAVAATAAAAAASAVPAGPPAAGERPAPRDALSGAPVRGLEGSPGEGYLRGPGGARLHYRYRDGTGIPVVLVHGRSIGAEGFSTWLDLFLPGRPILALDRRGYAPSAGDPTGSGPWSALNAGDVAAALDLARTRSPDGRACIVAFSLGARFLPQADPSRLLWAALLNPAAAPVAAHLPASEQAQAWYLLQTDSASRFWLPGIRRTWLKGAAGRIAADLERRVREQGGGGLGAGLAATLRSRMEVDGFPGILVDETLLGLYGPAASWGHPGVPTLLAASSRDELIPGAAYSAARERLASAGALVRDIRIPGGHLSPLLAPGPWMSAIEALDRDARAGRFSANARAELSGLADRGCGGRPDRPSCGTPPRPR